ncbi:MAG: M20/M25/M40 family metallo-hydrolase, partial [Bythopirellula sp.]
MTLTAKDLLQQLIRIPSVNPAFLPVDSNSTGEAQLTDFLQNFFENLGCPWFRQPVHPGRDNLLVVLRAPGEGGQQAPILWETHQDTVGVTGMKIDPFAASESQGRIWGRGACDVKGALAAMLAALTRIQAAGVAP